MTGKFPQDLSVNSNWNVGHSDGTPNLEAGLPYQLPTPSGALPSPWKGGLPNVAVTLQKGGYATAHYGKWHLGGCSPNDTHTPYPSEYAPMPAATRTCRRPRRRRGCRQRWTH